jgi:hypothetical protein
MSATFLAASSQKLSNAAPPVTAAPFTVGLWVYPTTTALRTIWSLAATANTSNTWNLDQTLGGLWSFSCKSSATAVHVDVGTVTVNAWAFVVLRAITTSNRRISVLQFDGSAVNGQETSAKTPTVTKMSLGCLESSAPSQFFSGNIGEFWYTNTDIQADGLALQDATLRQLAYGGPYSVPHIDKDIVEYHSLRSSLANSDGQQGDDVEWGMSGKQTWTNTGSVILGPHPPLPYWYASVRDRPAPTFVI